MKKKSLKKVLGHSAGLTPLVQKGDWLLEKENAAKGGGNKHSGGIGKEPRSIPKQVALAIIRDKKGGATDKHIMEKYGVSERYITSALNSTFINSSAGREILRNVVLENGIACGMHAKKHIGELSPMQAIVGTGVMVSKFVELDKHIQQTPAEVDFSELQKIGENLQDIQRQLGDLPDDEDADIIDIG